MEQMKATPANTAVICLMAYETDALIPPYCRFMMRTAKNLGIKLHIFGRGERYSDAPKELDTSFERKLIRLRQSIQTLPDEFKYILYVDARDCLFLRPLQVVCDEFNRIGWPILMSAERVCHHHIDPGWAARFPKSAAGYDYNNAGLWMAEREAFYNAVDKMAALSELVKNDKIRSSFPPLHNNDQHLWQTAYLEHAFPMRLDNDQRVFASGQQIPLDFYDFQTQEDGVPIVLKNGSRPAVIHFAGRTCVGMPFFAWLLNLVPFPNIPK